MRTQANRLGRNWRGALLALLFLAPSSAHAVGVKLTNDSYTSTNKANNNFGAATTVNVSSIEKGFLRFDLADLPAGVVSGEVEKATLKSQVIFTKISPFLLGRDILSKGHPHKSTFLQIRL